MSHILWRSLLEQNVDDFQRHLASATYATAPPKMHGGYPGTSTLQIGSPGTLATSPRASFKGRRASAHTYTQMPPPRNRGLVLSRSDVNSRDAFGRALLHHAASIKGPEAHQYVEALLKIPFVDLYAQDIESGWTPLHRALYQGNVSVAQALLQRDLRDATDYTTQAAHHHAGGLVKIKDNEGNSPFEVFGLTIAPRDIQANPLTIVADGADDETSNSVDLNENCLDQSSAKRNIRPGTDLHGDEVFAFGSNKNLTLGTGDEDDRQFPESIRPDRPEHVVQRIYEDYLLERAKSTLPEDLAASIASSSPASVPTIVRYSPVHIQDVLMSKLHTAILTDDPISNLYICGFGPGGRLGTGNEITCFSFKCITSGGLAKRKVISVALGQDHTIAICSQGEVFTWGGNKYGQLGYALPDVSPQEDPVQPTPRQLYGLVKKETMIGAAASSIHSAIFTAHSLYTFGKNEGQLGIMDADARSTGSQTTPRRVAPSVLQAQIKSVSVIDRATSVLLENHDVIVFTHYGWTKVVFPLDGLNSHFVSETLSTRYNVSGNYIDKITSGGNTICAKSSFGEVFTIDVPKPSESVSSSVSTTNPSKARNALPSAKKVWSIKKDHMSVHDVAVSSQDGSIILCTTSGSVWRKEKRANIKAGQERYSKGARTKDYKFVRAPNLTRAIAVRSNAYGAFMAVRRDCNVMREQIAVEAPNLWSNLFSLLAFNSYGQSQEDCTADSPQLRFWRPETKGPSPALTKKAIVSNPTAEEDLQRLCQRHAPLGDSGFDVWVTSNVTDMRIPVHSFIMMGRSKVLRAALSEFQQTYYFSIPEVMSVEYGSDGNAQMTFHGADFLTIAGLVFYLYTDELIDVWHFTAKALQFAPRYRSVRTELMKIASHLELRQLERAARLMIDPTKSLCYDMELALNDQELFHNADVMVELADGIEQPAHSVLLCARCPFFNGLFNGRAGGLWMSSRRGIAQEKSEAMKVDLKHVDNQVFQIVLRHLYADTGVDLFDEIIADTHEELVELIIEVLSVANELMIDRLAQICQFVLGKFVNMRNACGLLNAVSECSVTEFKNAGLEYVCLSLEGLMENRLLDELDPDLFAELDEVVKQNQTAFMPFARSGRAEAELMQRYPQLPDLLEQGRQRRADSMRLRSRLVDDEYRSGARQKSHGNASPRLQPQKEATESPSPGPSPAISAKDEKEELPFDMDDDAGIGSPSLSAVVSSSELKSRRQKEPDFQDDEYGSLPRQSALSSTPNMRETGLAISLSVTPTPAPIPSRLTSSHMDKGFDGRPWQASPRVGEKLDLKEIMAQTSVGRESGLTHSLERADLGPVKSITKISQKERKKQQQQLRGPSAEAASSTELHESPKVRTAGSPWQKIGQPRRLASPGVESAPVASAGPTRPAMTMRQTVAGGKSAEKVPQVKAKATRTTSEAATTKQPSQPVIQSIRHTPAPARTGFTIDGSSMSDILSQQQSEKMSIRDAASRRSLQEIQQEQEFQEWWNKESARVQEEEVLANSPTAKRGKGGRGRGSRGRGIGGGGTKKIRDNKTEGRSAAAHPSSSAEQSRGATLNGDGDGGVRGRGGRGQGRSRG